MRLEANTRIKILIDNIGLNPKISTYFTEGRLYYSYITAGGIIGSIDTISYNPKYESVFKDFEKEYDTLVYHCIESNTSFGNFLTMLYVGRDKDEWSMEKPSLDGTVMAIVYNFDENFSEIGYIKFKAYQGALIRVL